MNTGVKDISFVSLCTNLESLDVDGTQVIDLSPLSGLKKLEQLDVRRTSVSDISPLYGVSCLRNLFLLDTSVPSSQRDEIKRRISSISFVSRRSPLRPRRIPRLVHVPCVESPTVFETSCIIDSDSD
ncbi:hypothetical protein GEMRC1_005915 [Eukaryota sp. GEM-RC1]